MRSDNVKAGVQQAPHRSLFNALGFTQEEMGKPMVGIVFCGSVSLDDAPYHINLQSGGMCLWQEATVLTVLTQGI